MDRLNLNHQHNEYNDIPVLYCKHCLSLRIRNISFIEDSDYCDQCGSTEVGKSSIEDWETLYEEKYGHKYLENY